MSIRLEAELTKLKADGITPADLEASELAALVRACDRCDNPFSAVNAEAAGFPVRVCEGVTLWRLTAGACIWLDEYARRWWGEDTAHYKWAVFYAMHHAREAGAFLALTDEADAYRAIRADILGLNCTEEEIMAALKGFGDDDGARKPSALVTQADWRNLAQQLEGQTGIEAEKWLWERAAAYIAQANRRLVDFAVASGGGKAERMKDELDRAISNLARVTAGIRARVASTREGAKE